MKQMANICDYYILSVLLLSFSALIVTLDCYVDLLLINK